MAARQSEAQDRLHQRRLAGAVGAQQRHDLAGRDGEVADVEHDASCRSRAEEARPHRGIGAHLRGRTSGDDRRRRGRPADRRPCVSNSISWSTRMMPRSRRSPRSWPREQVALAIGHAGGRLVEQQERRAGRQRARQAGAARLALDRRLEGASDAGRAIACGRQALEVAPSSVMCRSRPRSRPLIALSSVVLPDPLGPISPTISPRSSVKETSRSASTPPKRLLTRSSTRRRGPACGRERQRASAAGAAWRR